MYCSKCGNKMNEGSQFCSNCGTAVVQLNQNTENIFNNQQQPIIQNQQPMPQHQINNQVNPIQQEFSSQTNQIVNNINTSMSNNQTYTNNFSMPNNKTIIWESFINGKTYKFNCQFGNMYQYTLTINDSQPMVLKGNIFSTLFMGFEKDFVFDNINMRLVVPTSSLGIMSSKHMSNADVVINNKFSRTGKEYIPTPKWIYIFVILCAIVVIGGGALPVLLAFGGIAGCLKAAKSNQSIGGKIASCIGITFVVWFIFILLVILASSLT